MGTPAIKSVTKTMFDIRGLDLAMHLDIFLENELYDSNSLMCSIVPTY